MLLVPMFAAGCASMEKRLVDVSRGMSPKEVQSALGTPKDKTFRGSQEIWTYDGGDGKSKVVVFQGGKVIDLLNVDPSKPGHALATEDVNTAENRTYACAGQNPYGKYAEGGGCNLYGCWPAGGYCNAFGCSTAGVCTANGCPNKIPSFRCRD
jgi:hypothetical protein